MFQHARFRGVFYFGNTFNAGFGVSHRFVTPIKDYRVSQPVHPVERGSQNFSKPSSKSQESKNTKGV